MKITDEVRISDNGFVFNARTGDSFTVNSTGLELAKLMSQGLEYDAIKDVFLKKYELDDLTFERDYHEFCAQIKNYEISTHEDPLDFK